MNRHAFDEHYLQDLVAGEPKAQSHFSTYFGELIAIKLRARHLSPEAIDDVRQETMLRVLKHLRQGHRIAHPEQFGSFVNTVCKNVLFEFNRQQRRNAQTETRTTLPNNAYSANEPESKSVPNDLDEKLITVERKALVTEILSELSDKDRELLKMLFFDELDKDTICRTLNVSPEYLRVLLHRSKQRFQTLLDRRLSTASRTVG